jgi:thioredoxin reductase (NADPH)
MTIAKHAVGLECAGGSHYGVRLSDGAVVHARAIIIASGVRYRKLELPAATRFEGAGVYHGATELEARLCTGDEVAVVGGANSAGQAAVFLAERAKHVHVLVRGEGLADTMSRYLVRRIEDNPRITLWTQTELVDLVGDDRVRSVCWRRRSRPVETRDIGHVFLMIGAEPNSQWLQGCVALDAKGFVKTGQDVSPDERAAAAWPVARGPLLLETNRHRVFAVGDIRAGSVKRVASAVGEGSICVQLVHRALAE